MITVWLRLCLAKILLVIIGLYLSNNAPTINPNTITSNTAIPDNIWHHVAVTYDGTTAYLYIDGVLDTSKVLASPTPNGSEFAIGAIYIDKANVQDYFKGDIDEIRVWDNALTLDQLHYVMNQELVQSGAIVNGSVLPNTITKNDFVIIFLFLGALFVFMVVGVYGIFDILETISTHFEKLKEKKEEAKEEIATAPQEAKIGKQIVHFLNKMGVDYDRETMIKTNGERAFVDFTIYLNKTPEYLVEVLTKPTSQNVYKVSTKLEFYKEITGMKTILISDFSANKPALEAAERFPKIASNASSII